MKDHSRVVVHLVELIDAADTTIRQDEGTTLENKLSGLWIFRDVDGKTDR